MVKKDLICIMIILLFSIFGMKALFHPGLYTAHDIWHQVARLYHYQEAVGKGIFPPYWISNMANGYGYPLFFFSYNLPWLLGLPFLKIGFDIPTTLKILFFLAYFCSGVSMYLFVKVFLKDRLAALASGILYLWAPYHFLEILVSASIGVVFSFIFLPLLFLGIYLGITKTRSKAGTLAVISLSIVGIVLSHLLTAFFMIPCTLIFIAYLYLQNKQQKNGLKIVLPGLLLGALISSFYLIPAIYYSKFIKAATDAGFSTLYLHNFINFRQLLYSKWGYGPISKDAKAGEISFQMGIAQWVSIAGILVLLFTKASKSRRLLILSVLAAFAVSVFMMLDYSKPIWKILSNMATFDYPTRFMLPVTFLGTLSTALLISIFKERKIKIILLVFLLAVALYTNRNYTKVNLYTNIPISLYVASEQTTNTYNEYLPKNADQKLLSKPYSITGGEDSRINGFFQNTQGIGFKINLSSKNEISAGQLYFPGITAYLDNKKVESTIDKQGRVMMLIPSGEHNVIVKFEDTPIIKASEFLTIFGLLILLLPLFRKKFAFN